MKEQNKKSKKKSEAENQPENIAKQPDVNDAQAQTDIPQAEESEASPAVENKEAEQVKPEDKLAEERIKKILVEQLNTMNLGAAVSKAAEDAVDAKLKPLLDQIQNLVPVAPEAGISKAPDNVQEGSKTQNQEAGSGVIGQLITAFLTRQISGNGGGGMGGMADFFKAMAAFQEASNALYMQPQLQALNMYSTLFKTGASVGKTPTDLASSADTIAESIRNAAKTKPAQ
jgi:hypothetical protein